jgi:lysozyme family protein
VTGDPFDRAVALVLEIEGPMDDKPKSDPDGGLTKFGIAQKQHPGVDVATLTREGALAIYRSEYWDKTGASSLPWPLSLLLFDGAVNQGVTVAAELLEATLKTPVDGRIGPNDVAATHKCDLADLCARFAAKRGIRYSKTLNFGTNGEGWLYRLALCCMNVAVAAP